MKHTPSAAPAARLLAAAHAMGVPLDPADAGALVALLDRVSLEPQNLTAIEAVTEGVDRHLADSIAALGPPPALASPLCDLGSGGGFPGLPLAMCRPDLRITLVESERRKADWLGRASAALPNVEVVNDRSETFARHSREAFAAVTARAVAPLVPCLELAAPLVAPGGRAVLWAGPRDRAAAADAAPVAQELGLRLEEVRQVTPFPGAQRALLVYRKVGPTPA
ncbi:MAG TPA: 16S rRNA (guanine(527)-N(7))-methyltransferase RsmG, partial [Miltoncostaeaceae bacterium]|nr:16S rRNA (guanine(527)-N(7))-methyltransferase RsmG [Miltoncostaeaceae bacterium]